VDNFLARIWEDLAARVTGPLHFRLLLQPAMATIFAIRDGIRDGPLPPLAWTHQSNDPVLDIGSRYLTHLTDWGICLPFWCLSARVQNWWIPASD
jgi:hypothetical protein